MTLAWVFLAASADDESVPASRARSAGQESRVPQERPVDPHAAVVDRVRAGDDQAFDALYRSFYAPLVAFVAYQGVPRAVAEELVQETFLAVWRSRERWDVRGTVREYFFGAVRNRALDHLRHERVVRSATHRVGPEAVAGIARKIPIPDTLVTEAELRDAVDELLEGMPVERRQVLVLRWQENLSYPEIASVLGISVDAAKQQGSRAQRALRILLQRFRP